MTHCCEAPRSKLSNYFGEEKNKYLEVLLGEYLVLVTKAPPLADILNVDSLAESGLQVLKFCARKSAKNTLKILHTGDTESLDKSTNTTLFIYLIFFKVKNFF